MLIQKLVFALILLASAAFAQITPPPSGGGGGGSTPGGANHDVQCNESNAFGACNTGVLIDTTLIYATSPGAGVAHFAGGTQQATSTLIVNADITNGTIAAAKLVGTDIATVGTITSGIWNGTAILKANLDPTLVFSAAALTNNAIVTGAGAQGSKTPAATATLDTSGNFSTPGTISTGVGGSAAGAWQCAQGTAPTANANSFGWTCPATMTTSVILQSPNAVPAANQVMLFPAPTSNISQWTWTNISGTGSFCMTTSCTMVTPALGTPTALVLTNATGLPVAGGGTGASTLTAHGPLVGEGTSAIVATGAGTSGQCYLSNGAAADPSFQACPGGAGAGNSVTSTTPVTVNTNTTADQQLMELSLGAGYFNSSKQPFLFDGAGVYTTQTAQTPTITLKVKLCTVSGCGSGTVVTLISIVSTATVAAVSNNNWNLAVLGYTATTGAAGNLEIHGPLAVDLGALTTTADSIFVDTNTAVSSNIDLTAALFVDFTIAFSTNAVTANTFTQRSGGVMPFAATAAPVTSVNGNTGAVTGVVFNNTANTGTAAMTLDMSASTTANAYKVPVGAGLTAGADGAIAYDSTAKITHVRTNGADSSVVAATATSTTTTQVLHATATAGIGAFSPIVSADLPTATKARSLNFIFDGGGSAVATGNTVAAVVPDACTISAYNISLDAGTATFKMWKVATGTAIPTSGNSINTSGVAISSGTSVHSTTVSDFTTTAVAANDIVIGQLSAVATAKWVSVQIECDN